MFMALNLTQKINWLRISINRIMWVLLLFNEGLIIIILMLKLDLQNNALNRNQIVTLECKICVYKL